MFLSEECLYLLDWINFFYTERIWHIDTEKHHKARVKPRPDAMLFLDEQHIITANIRHGYCSNILFTVAASWLQRSQLKGSTEAEVKTASPTLLGDENRNKMAKIEEKGGLWTGVRG